MSIDAKRLALTAIAGKLGCSPDSLRVWVRQGQRDGGERPGQTSAEKARISRLLKKSGETAFAAIFTQYTAKTPNYLQHIVSKTGPKGLFQQPVRACPTKVDTGFVGHAQKQTVRVCLAILSSPDRL